MWGSGATPAVKLAFEFLVLTAARSGEVRGARWAEIDLPASVWTVPAEAHEVQTRAPGSAVRARGRDSQQSGDGRSATAAARSCFASQGGKPILA